MTPASALTYSSTGRPPNAATPTLSTRSTLQTRSWTTRSPANASKAGRSTIQAQRGEHPAEHHLTIRRIQGTRDLWVTECVITYDGMPTYSLSIMKISDGL